MDNRHLFPTWVDSPFPKAQSTQGKLPVRLGRSGLCEDAWQGANAGASVMFPFAKASSAGRRLGAFFAIWTVAPMGLNSPFSPSHKGSAPGTHMNGSVPELSKEGSCLSTFRHFCPLHVIMHADWKEKD